MKIFKSFFKHGIVAVIIEGFGNRHLSHEHRNLLNMSLGRNVIINGITQLRAGVIRPKIIIPSDEEFYKIKKADGKYLIIWGDNYGKMGKIKGPFYYEETSSEIKTWFCSLFYEDGKEIKVPFRNLSYEP
jgi:hypothetical protein